MDTIEHEHWIARCAMRLRQRWSTVDEEELRQAASLIWNDPPLRALPPEAAAERWLRPVTVGRPDPP